MGLRLAKAVGKDNLGIAVYPTVVNIGGQDVQQKAFMGVKFYAVNQTPSATLNVLLLLNIGTAFDKGRQSNNQFTNEDRHIIPANKEVQASERSKDALHVVLLRVHLSSTQLLCLT